MDFCCRAGLHLIQVLPVNDTSVRKTWRDSYPYSAICVFALHPMYVRLDSLPGAQSSSSNAGGSGIGVGSRAAAVVAGVAALRQWRRQPLLFLLLMLPLLLDPS